MSDPVTRLNAALEGRYHIESEIGEGGMATVYLAEDLKHHRQVAVKVLRPELAAVVGADRFLHEIKLTANLQHPHILALHDSGEADGLVFYVMPFVEGDSLRDKLNREKQLSVEETIEITKGVASALDYAHRHEVLIESADAGERITYHWAMLPVMRIVKAISRVFNLFGAEGPVPDAVSVHGALLIREFDLRHASIKATLLERATAFRDREGYTPPYWELLEQVRDVRRME